MDSLVLGFGGKIIFLGVGVAMSLIMPLQHKVPQPGTEPMPLCSGSITT